MRSLAPAFPRPKAAFPVPQHPARHACARAAARLLPGPSPRGRAVVAAAAAMRLLVALDGSDASAHLVERALAAAHGAEPAGEGEVHLVAVLPPPVVAVPPSPVATAAAVTAVLAAQEQQHRADEARAKAVLQEGTAAAMDAGLPRSHVHAHMLPAAGGASGVGESLVEFARAKGVDVVAVGSRGMGSLKSSLMSIVGLGSVSDYLAHHLKAPLLVVRPKQAGGVAAAATGDRGRPRVIVLAIDDSPHSSHALRWVLAHLAGPGDELHLATVALPVPYPIMDEASAALAAAEAEEWRAGAEASGRYARELAGRAAAAARAGGRVPAGRVRWAALEPEGGAGDVGAALVAYAKEHAADLVVVGSRGMGAIKRGLMSFVGLGSVSDYLVHHLEAPVLVVKGEEGALPDRADHAEGAAEAASAPHLA